MGLTLGGVTRLYRGPISIVYVEFTFDSGYAAAGETVTASDLGLSSIKACWPTATAGYNVTYARTNDQTGKLAIYASLTPDTNSAVSAPLDSSVGRDYSLITIPCLIVGNAL